jgi:hypothetical protein
VSELERLERFDLVPVVELEAWAFSSRESPGYVPDPEAHCTAWGAYWFACLADAGITDLEPIALGSRHVVTDALGASASLRAILARLVPVEERTDPEAVGALSGGFALVANGRVVQEPMCCSDLVNNHDWRALIDYREPAWRMVWIGHPWLSARADGDDIVLSLPSEGAPPEPAWVLNRALIHPALARATARLEALVPHVAAALLDGEGNGRNARAVALKLCGLPWQHEWDDE